MRVRLLCTDGQGDFKEVCWEKPEILDNEIEVKSVMTGICRSDIDMMQGKFKTLPVDMHGHEGLGIVTKIGKNISDVSVGDFVATRGEPAYADIYNVKQEEYVVVPELHPRYIIEPVACGINLVYQCMEQIILREGKNAKLCIMGSGFLAYVAYTLLKSKFLFDIDVVGNSNKEIWGNILKNSTEGPYDVIIDLSDNSIIFEKIIYKENALLIIGNKKQVTTDFSDMLWKAVTMIFPSPRNPNFNTCMKLAVNMIKNKELNVDNFWSKSYNRDTEWQNAFKDGINRDKKYKRGYIEWR